MTGHPCAKACFHSECRSRVSRGRVFTQPPSPFIFIRTDIVDSHIPLLLRKNLNEEAKIKPDLENDKVEIFGKLFDLDCTSSRHYCVPLHSTLVNVEECMLAEKIEDISDKTENLKQDL